MRGPPLGIPRAPGTTRGPPGYTRESLDPWGPPGTTPGRPGDAPRSPQDLMCLLMEASAPFSRPHYGQLRSFTVNYGRRLRSITVNYGHLGSITLADYGQLRSFTVNYGRRLRSITVIYSRQLRSPITVGDSCTPQISKPKVMVLEPKILVLNRF